MELLEKIRITTDQIRKMEEDRGRNPDHVFTRGNCGNFFMMMQHVLQQHGTQVKPIFSNGGKGHVWCEISEGNQLFICDVGEIVDSKKILKTYHPTLEQCKGDHELWYFFRKKNRHDIEFSTEQGHVKGYYSHHDNLEAVYGDMVYDMPASETNGLVANSSNFSAKYPAESGYKVACANATLANAAISAGASQLRVAGPKEYEEKVHAQHLAALDDWLKTDPFGEGRNAPGRVKPPAETVR